MLKKRIADKIFKPLLKQYLKFDTRFKYKGLGLTIFSGVFHPQFFFSSKYLAGFIETLELKNKQFCEPCSGSGFVSLLAYRNGANVFCFDINPLAVKNIQLNYKINFGHNNSTQQFIIKESDNFTNVPQQQFDVIVLNPPYFFNEATDNAQLAWNCGKEGEFFVSFFSSLSAYLAANGKCYMVLAENCEIERIAAIAHFNGFNFILVQQKKISWEKNYIFEITKAIKSAI